MNILLILLILSVFTSFHCLFRESRMPEIKINVDQKTFPSRKNNLKSQISIDHETLDEKNLTIKDLLLQFQIKKEEYCSTKINDLDDFPVSPENMCCDLGFMNIDPKKGKIHYGLDIPLLTGTPLKCPDKEGCLVVKVYPEWYYSNGVLKQTIYGESLLVYFKKAGYFGFYAHLQKILGRQGKIFTYGKKMAFSGNTGSLSTGAHLHFALFRNQDCSNGVFNEKMRLAVLDTIEEIKVFEARERGLDPAFYNLEDRNAADVLKRCKVNLNQEANRACIARNFPRDFIDPLEVTSDSSMQKLILEINPKRMSDREILRIFSLHRKVRNGAGIHREIEGNVPANLFELQEFLKDVH